jgi:hypothetical protein
MGGCIDLVYPFGGAGMPATQGYIDGCFAPDFVSSGSPRRRGPLAARVLIFNTTARQPRFYATGHSPSMSTITTLAFFRGLRHGGFSTTPFSAA